MTRPERGFESQACRAGKAREMVPAHAPTSPQRGRPPVHRSAVRDNRAAPRRRRLLPAGYASHVGQLMSDALVAIDAGFLCCEQETLVSRFSAWALAGDVHRIRAVAVAAFERWPVRHFFRTVRKLNFGQAGAPMRQQWVTGGSSSLLRFCSVSALIAASHEHAGWPTPATVIGAFNDALHAIERSTV
jgi:hypothetical protein